MLLRCRIMLELLGALPTSNVPLDEVGVNTPGKGENCLEIACIGLASQASALSPCSLAALAVRNVHSAP
jgi:hypothetical protein